MAYTHVYRNPVSKTVTVTNSTYVPVAGDVLMTATLAHNPDAKDPAGSAHTHTLYTHIWNLFAAENLPDVVNYSIVTNEGVPEEPEEG